LPDLGLGRVAVAEEDDRDVLVVEEDV